MKSSLARAQFNSLFDEKPPEKTIPKIKPVVRIIKPDGRILEPQKPLEIIQAEKQAQQQSEQAETPARRERRAPAPKVTPIRKATKTKAKQKAIKTALVVDDRPLPPADEFQDEQLKDWLQFIYSLYGTHRACAEAFGLEHATWYQMYKRCADGTHYGNRPGRVTGPALRILIDNVYRSTIRK